MYHTDKNIELLLVMLSTISYKAKVQFIFKQTIYFFKLSSRSMINGECMKAFQQI